MTAAATVSSVFVPLTVSLGFETPFVPNQFFRNRSGLWVSDSFRDLVVAKAKVTEAGQIFTVKPQTLGCNATDAEIEDPVIGMGPSHLFDETLACAIIGGFIVKQPNGEEGALLNNGFANLLYLPSCIVDVRWRAGSRKWDVSVGQRDYWWNAGDQVFSPETAA